MKTFSISAYVMIFHPLGYERVDLPLHKVADTPFHIQGDDLISDLEAQTFNPCSAESFVFILHSCETGISRFKSWTITN